MTASWEWDWQLAQSDRLMLLEKKLLTLIHDVEWFRNDDGSYRDEGPAILKTLAETEEILRRLRATSPQPAASAPRTTGRLTEAGPAPEITASGVGERR